MRLLHVSDLHFSERTRWDAGDVLSRLIIDVRSQRDPVFDLLIVTGDVAYSGRPAEYALARAWLDALRDAAGLSADRVVLVRGNHDVDRAAFGAAGKALVQAITGADAQTQQEMLEDPEARALVLRPARAWVAFAAPFGSPLDRTWGPRRFAINGKTLHVAVLDSAWSCFGEDGGVPPDPMVAEALAGADGADLVLVATHHPVPEGASAGPRLRRAFGVLRGHLHDHDPSFVQRKDQTQFVLACGSAYGGSRWTNAYQILDFDAGGVRITERKWDPRRLVWDAGQHWGVSHPVPELADSDRLCDEIRRRANDWSWLTEALGRAVCPTDALVQVLDTEGLAGRVPLRSLVGRENQAGQPWWRLDGEPGAGKSTAVKRLVLDLLDEGAGWVPVLLHARAAVDHKDPFAAIAHEFPGLEAAAQLAKSRSRLVFVLDGVDEVLGPRKAVADALTRWTVKLRGVPVLLAGRPHGAVDVPGFEKRALCALEPEQQQALLEALGMSAARAKGTLDTMRADGARMAQMTGNPLILSLVAFVVKEKGEMPRSRQGLYEDVLYYRFFRHQVNKESEAVARPTEVRQLLEDIAHALSGVEPWSYEAVVASLKATAAWPEVKQRGKDQPDQTPDDFLDEIARETGLIRRARRVFEPPHRTLREYLVACALHRKGVTDPDLAAAERDEGRWAEVLALLAARLGKEATGLVARLRARGEPAAPLMWKVLADANDIDADEVVAAVGLTGGRDDWETRMKTLAGLPELVGRRLDLVLDVSERLGRGIVHGAEIWQLREVVGRVRDGLTGTVGPEQTVDAVRARAAALFEQILILHPDRGPTVRDEVRARIEWRRVRAGTSWIGAHPDDPTSYDDEKPGRWVEITQDVDLARDPVTNRLYERFDPGHVAERGTSAKRPDAADHPVVRVSWYEAAAFAAWLGNGVALPDEVVWEHACRGGKTTAYWSGNTEADLRAVGWYQQNAGGRTHAVGDVPSARANERGLRHLHGNVWEWTAFGWTPNHKDLPARFDPERPSVAPPADGRVVRGGSRWDVPQYCRSAYRYGGHPSLRVDFLGFRLVRLPASCTEFDR